MPCTHPAAQNFIIILCTAAVLHLFISIRFHIKFKIPAVIYTCLLLLTLWLGIYSISPLDNPMLRGFLVTTNYKEHFIQPSDIILLSSGSTALIQPDLMHKQVNCQWLSVQGAALDEPNICDVIYNPPDTDYDILKLNIQSACGLPASNWQIKISILP
jgi:hypothetical protein